MSSGRATDSARPAAASDDVPKPKTPVGDAIGQKLKAEYDKIAQEPVPDRFMDLLKQLEDGPDDDGSKETE